MVFYIWVEKKNPSNRKTTIKICSTISFMVTATDSWKILYLNTPIPSSPFRTLEILPITQFFEQQRKKEFFSRWYKQLHTSRKLHRHCEKYTHKKKFSSPNNILKVDLLCVLYHIINFYHPFPSVKEILCQTHTYRSSLQKPHHVKVICLLRLDYRKACVPLQTVLSLSQSTQHMQRLFQE